jgi:hypothetical protein
MVSSWGFIGLTTLAQSAVYLNGGIRMAIDGVSKDGKHYLAADPWH